MLRRLAWSSLPSPAFPAERLPEVTAASGRYCERHHISGMLLYTGAHYLCVLEGHQHDVRKLWSLVQADARHRDPLHIGERRCGRRWFPAWSLACADHPDMRAEVETLRAPLEQGAKDWADVIHPLLLRAEQGATGAPRSPAKYSGQVSLSSLEAIAWASA